MVLIAGFAGCGWPESLIKALVDQGSKNLTVICQGDWREQHGEGGRGAGIRPLVAGGQVCKLISPMPFQPAGPGDGPSPATKVPVTKVPVTKVPVTKVSEVDTRWKSGELEIEVVPQGVLAERLRSGGAGLGGVFLPTGAGTRFGAASEVRNFGGRDHLFEPALKAEFALLRAAASDTLGNLVFHGTQRNWNPVMAMAAGVSIVEVDEIYAPGELDGELVVTPGIFVNRIVKTR